MASRNITIAPRNAGARLCQKCRELTTEGGVVSCGKGHEHFNATDCPDYDDASSPHTYFGGTTGRLVSWEGAR